MKPLLAHVYEPHRVTFPCFVQPKLNGIRALYQNGSFQSRDEHPFPPGLLRHLAEPLLAVFGPEVILDGELYHHGWPLQKINGAVTPVRLEEKSDTSLVEYHVFDVVNYTKTFAERFFDLSSKAVLYKIHAVETKQVFNKIQADLFYAECVRNGYEGMMYRLGDCPYTVPRQQGGPMSVPINNRSKFLSDQDNRVWHLLKRKSWQDDEFEIVGVVEGEGKYEGLLGAITCSVKYKDRPKMSYSPNPTFTVGSGLSDLDRAKFFDHPELIIGKQAKVKYLCLSEAGIPLNPTLLAIL